MKNLETKAINQLYSTPKNEPKILQRW